MTDLQQKRHRKNAGRLRQIGADLWRTGGICADARGFNELSESEFSTLTDKCHHDSFPTSRSLDPQRKD